MAIILHSKKAQTAFNIILVVLGSFVLAAGDAFFTVPCNLVMGGCSSVGIIIQYFVGDSFEVVDIVVWTLEILMLILSLLFLGKKYFLKTLLATIAYPAFFTILYRFGAGTLIESAIQDNENEILLITLMAGLFGGALIGLGVALTFIGGGSTGGFDVIASISAKYTPIKEGMTTLIVDAICILAGMICFAVAGQQSWFIRGLIGIVGAAICAFLIQIVFVSTGNYVVCDIVCEKRDEILNFIHNELSRGTTILASEGGYTGEKRIVIRVALSKRETIPLKAFIQENDPYAFVIISPAAAVRGNGFTPFKGGHIDDDLKDKK